jgi:hypothetical protein
MMERVRNFGGWTWLVLALLIIGILTVVGATTPAPGRPLGADNAEPGGGLALRLWLQRLGYYVETTSALPGAGEPSQASAALALDPERELSSQELSDLRGWVSTGGTAVIATDGSATGTFAALGMPLAYYPSSDLSVSEPLLRHPETTEVQGDASLVGRQSPAPGAVVTTPAGPVMIRRSIGRGVLWLLTVPDLLDNSHLVHADNRKLALNLVGPGTRRVILAQLGPSAAASGGGSTDWLTGSVWGVALWFLLLTVLLFRWLGGWRLGPPTIPFQERRRPAVEYVISLADLLRRARKRGDVLAIYQRGLRRAVRRRLGTDETNLLAPAVRRQVEELLERPAELSEDELLQRVAQILESEEEVRSAHV